jgi:hypothetical protein
MEPLRGNLMVDPLSDTEGGGLFGLGDRLRSWDWPVPDEVLMFGGNGADDQFGLWYPAGTPASEPTPVVMIGAVFEPASLALAGTEFARFLPPGRVTTSCSTRRPRMLSMPSDCRMRCGDSTVRLAWRPPSGGPIRP